MNIEKELALSTVLTSTADGMNCQMMIRVSETDFMPLLNGNAQMVVSCQDKFVQSLRFHMRHYIKALESLKVIAELSTDPIAAAEAKDRLND